MLRSSVRRRRGRRPSPRRSPTGSAEIVSADAMQVYRGLPILTTSPSGRQHSSGSGHSPTSRRSPSTRGLRTQPSIEVFYHTAHAVVVGGTGLYLRAALAELTCRRQPGARERWERVSPRGDAAAHAVLAARDPRGGRVHLNDRRRSCARSSSPRRAHRCARNDGCGGETRHPTLVVGLDVPRGSSSGASSRAPHAMFDAGVVAEVRRGARRRRLAHSWEGPRPP